MAAYPELQEKLNTDPKHREEFFKDPVGTLRRAGIEITPEKETTLKEFVAHAQKAPGASAQRISVNAGVSISVRF